MIRNPKSTGTVLCLRKPAANIAVKIHATTKESQLLPAKAGSLAGSATSRLKFFINLEVSIWRFFTLFLNIFYYYFISNIARTCGKVPTCPHMPTPKCLTQALVFHQQFSRCFTFERLYQLANRYVRWNRHKYMHMICRHMTFEYFYIFSFANLTNQIPYPFCYFTTKDWLAVFSYP